MAELTAFASAQSRNSDQQRALLGAIAESGTAGAQAYKQAQDQNQQLQQAALGAAAGTGAAAPVVQGKLAGSLALNANALSGAKASFEADIARQQASNSAYMDQVGAAVPIVESRTRMGVEQLLAEAQARRERDAMEMEQARMSLQGQRENLAGQREARAAARAERAADAKGGGLTAYQREQIRLAEADNKRADDQITAKGAEAASDRREGKQASHLEGLRSRWGTTDDSGKVVKDGESYKAVYAVFTGSMSLDEALNTYKTPGGKPLSRSALEAELNRLDKY